MTTIHYNTTYTHKQIIQRILLGICFLFASVSGINAQRIDTIPMPAGAVSISKDYFSISHKGYLYNCYKNSSGKFQLAKYDGITNVLVPNLSATDIGCVGEFIIFNDTLFFQYGTSATSPNIYQLAKYDGTNIILIPNVSTTHRGHGGYPIIYKNALYYRYGNSTFYQLAKYDGTTTTLIANPTSLSTITGIRGAPIIYNDSLYYSYHYGSYSSGGLDTLVWWVKFNGTTLSLLPNASNRESIISLPIIYKNKLCFIYIEAPFSSTGSFTYFFAKYNGTTIATHSAPGGYTKRLTFPAIEYQNNLYYYYENNTSDYKILRL